MNSSELNEPASVARYQGSAEPKVVSSLARWYQNKASRQTKWSVQLWRGSSANLFFASGRNPAKEKAWKEDVMKNEGLLARARKFVDSVILLH